jgi:spore germination cell wall hydrolase CwlJ-like protein
MAQAIYAEARAESFAGKQAVAHVIMNRAKKQKKSPCEIVRQRGQFKYRTGGGSQWLDSMRAAANRGYDLTRGSLYFKAKHARVKWPHKFVTSIGNHLFYK